jgi:archaemetzincin
MDEQLRGDWTSTKEGQKDKLENLEDFLRKETRHAKEGQSLGFFSIGKLPEQIPTSELKEFVAAYFSLPVDFLTDQGGASIPSDAWRSILCYVPQANANRILIKVLAPLKEPNAGRYWGITAITHEDLMCDPDDDLDYVYGLSREGETGLPGIAIVSTRRIWRPAAVGFELSRLRFLKLVTHEIGHLFHAQHCLKHACNMNGVETVDQIDRHPLEVCPECMAKICWIGGTHPKVRYERLTTVCERLNLQTEGCLYQRCRKLL